MAYKCQNGFRKPGNTVINIYTNMLHLYSIIPLELNMIEISFEN